MGKATGAMIKLILAQCRWNSQGALMWVYYESNVCYLNSAEIKYSADRASISGATYDPPKPPWLAFEYWVRSKSWVLPGEVQKQ